MTNTCDIIIPENLPCCDVQIKRTTSLKFTDNNFKEVYGYEFSEFLKMIKKAKKDLRVELVTVNDCHFTHLCKIRSKKGNADFKVVVE